VAPGFSPKIQTIKNISSIPDQIRKMEAKKLKKSKVLLFANPY
jgi:hypothetical protein